MLFRSMNGKAIIYPYWENIARGYADILMVLTLFGILFLAYPVGLGIVFFCIWWRHKGWTMKDVWHRAKDFGERWVEKLREKRIKSKEGREKTGKTGKKRKKRRKSEYEDLEEETGSLEEPEEVPAAVEYVDMEEESGEESPEEPDKKKKFRFRRGRKTKGGSK